MKEATVSILIKVVKRYCFLENIQKERLDSKDWARIERLYNNYLTGEVEL